jgi:hypothetical protein
MLKYIGLGPLWDNKLVSNVYEFLLVWLCIPFVKPMSVE